ncbi:MAG: NMD3-related protein [Promethearchaeati archaeon SRVP18_Atabeyarchaeia-1]
MANRKRFCVVCGSEETQTNRLYNGLCGRCSAIEKPSEIINTTPTIRLCKICGSLEEKGKWIAPSSGKLQEDLSTLLRRMATKFVRVEKEERVEVSIPQMPIPIGSKSVLIPFCIRTKGATGQHEHPQRESMAKVRLTPSICSNCTLMKQKYYEATLQVRTSDKKMRPEERENLLGRIDAWVEEGRRKDKQAFISKYEDKPEGFDLYLGSRSLAYSIASKFRAMKGTSIKETFKIGNVDKSTGKRKSKATILIRLPPQIVDGPA